MPGGLVGVAAFLSAHYVRRGVCLQRVYNVTGRPRYNITYTELKDKTINQASPVRKNIYQQIFLASGSIPATKIVAQEMTPSIMLYAYTDAAKK